MMMKRTEKIYLLRTARADLSRSVITVLPAFIGTLLCQGFRSAAVSMQWHERLLATSDTGDLLYAISTLTMLAYLSVVVCFLLFAFVYRSAMIHMIRSEKELIDTQRLCGIPHTDIRKRYLLRQLFPLAIGILLGAVIGTLLFGNILIAEFTTYSIRLRPATDSLLVSVPIFCVLGILLSYHGFPKTPSGADDTKKTAADSSVLGAVESAVIPMGCTVLLLLGYTLAVSSSGIDTDLSRVCKVAGVMASVCISLLTVTMFWRRTGTRIDRFRGRLELMRVNGFTTRQMRRFIIIPNLFTMTVGIAAGAVSGMLLTPLLCPISSTRIPNPTVCTVVCVLCVLLAVWTDLIQLRGIDVRHSAESRFSEK